MQGAPFRQNPCQGGPFRLEKGHAWHGFWREPVQLAWRDVMASILGVPRHAGISGGQTYRKGAESALSRRGSMARRGDGVGCWGPEACGISRGAKARRMGWSRSVAKEASLPLDPCFSTTLSACASQVVLLIRPLVGHGAECRYRRWFRRGLEALSISKASSRPEACQQPRACFSAAPTFGHQRSLDDLECDTHGVLAKSVRLSYWAPFCIFRRAP